ncbi:UDP-glucose dehydrogenase family protein [Rhodohalobacter sulfatireducens]|uniref:UDP-glucose 6-dehydrogenase n=1 Tax=Rhodohalobacter sulfatireducens TaxID=2911366 RepID=A0ABS9KF23_9BACT|nr:UDP-glucose/GDP-mannose dehydrogenase family protein [Rhodohalobacter sulfatireducens]MCG2589426.1 UDP-glucose/GDP-mannose dehydrogenase family protein [Rhodohalobacter sulfatireducens]MDR9363709.1 UDP-glucose/GDP-mannose dehydrogenase family protein [Balneolaceae bacterium]MDR9408362.1 UDP-glucose/GDP-mannose dehydrogenase family protein [Balneolaceae bacterium]
MKIGVIGTGYVGLVTGTCFADSGNDVICVDIDEKKVQRMQNGEVPIYEPGLNRVFDRAIREKRLHFTTRIEEAFKESEIIFLCLPTPPGANGQADLSFVLDVANDLGDLFNKYPGYKVIVNKSTVPVGTADKVKEKIAQKTDTEFDVVSNPEFLREGAAVEDFMKPERVVVGTTSEKAADLMTTLYEPFVRSGNPIIIMDERSSELTKYAANAMLATKITFMNEIANVCEKVGANVDNVRRGIGTDTRIGKRFLFAGIGYGGSCFPKDVQAIHHTADEYGYEFKILDSVMKVNESQKVSIVDKMKLYYNGNLEGKTVGIWGLSFKPETDDIREAPSLYITEQLAKMGVSMKAYDPEAIETFKEASSDETLSKMQFVEDRDSVIDGVDALIICTEWNEFRRPDMDRFAEVMNEPVIFDGRNLYDLDRARDAGLTYISVGRPSVNI